MRREFCLLCLHDALPIFLAEAGLNFLGVSTGGVISWGTMITNAQKQGALTLGWWWWFLPPGIAIAIIGTATAMVNLDRKSTRLNSSHVAISYAVYCMKKK